MIVAVSSRNDRRMKPKVNVKLLTAGSEIGKITQPEVDECHYLDITPKKMTPSISESRGYNAFRKPIYETKRCAAMRGDAQRCAAMRYIIRVDNYNTGSNRNSIRSPYMLTDGTEILFITKIGNQLRWAI